jgi:ubiquinone/menaquinone biosynthesis C-methylase UbiE
MTSPKDSSLQKEYHLRFKKRAEYRNSVWQILCKDYFSKFIPQNSRLLDIGAGWGEFINNIEVDTKFAMDLNPETKSRISLNVEFLHQDCSVTWPFKSDFFDVIFTSNFLEHLSTKEAIQKTLGEAHRCLKENGIIICMGPNIKYLTKTYWDFWDHKIPISDSAISELLKITGFTIDLSKSRFLPYTMSTGRTPPLFFVKMYIRLPFLWNFIGKQFLVIGRKVQQK